MLFWEFVGHFFFYPLTHLCKLNNNKGLAQVFCQELCNVGLIAPYRIDRSSKTTHNSLHFLCKNNNIEDITMHNSYKIEVPKARLIQINPECSSYTELPFEAAFAMAATRPLLGSDRVFCHFTERGQPVN